MKNFDYKTKYHYVVKYFIIAFPFIAYLILSLSGLNNDLIVDLKTLFVELKNMSMNSWYDSILTQLGLDNIYLQSDLGCILVIYPLYILWIYLIDIILDVVLIIPKLGHKLIEKIGGSNL